MSVCSSKVTGGGGGGVYLFRYILSFLLVSYYSVDCKALSASKA